MSMTSESKIREFLNWADESTEDQELIEFAANIGNNNGSEFDRYVGMLDSKHYNHDTNYLYHGIGMMACFGEKIFSTDDVVFFRRLLVQ